MGHVAQEMHTIFLLENLKGRDHLEDLDIDGNILDWIVGIQVRKEWTGCFWFRIGTSGGLL